MTCYTAVRHRLKSAIEIGLVMLTGGLIGIVGPGIPPSQLLLFACLASLGLIIWRYRFGGIVPVLVGGVLTFVGVVGRVGSGWYHVPENLGSHVEADVALYGTRVGMTFLWAALGFVAGWVLASGSSASRRPSVGMQLHGIRRGTERQLRLAACGSVVVPLALATGVGWSTLLERADYLMFDGPGILVRLATPLSLAAAAIAAYAAGASTQNSTRAVAGVGILLLAVVAFSLGSRTFALLPLPLALGAVLAGRLSRRGVILLVIVACATTIALARVPISLRALPMHGFKPYASALAGGDVNLGIDPAGLAGSLLMSFPITTETMFGPDRLVEPSLRIALSPAPGGAAGWDEVQESYRLNIYTPYSGLGELGVHGASYVFSFLAAAGALFGGAQRLAERCPPRVRGGVMALLVAVAGYELLLLLQYNLRSAARVLYLAAACVGVLGVLVFRGFRLTGLRGSSQSSLTYRRSP